MAAPIGPGDWVECVFAGDPEKVGTIWQCEDVSPSTVCPACSTRCGAIALVGVPESRNPRPHWSLCCFRPIYRPRADFIEALKQPVTRTPKVVKPIREDA